MQLQKAKEHHVNKTKSKEPMPLMSTRRMETLIDGVFAIAMTLFGSRLQGPHHTRGFKCQCATETDTRSMAQFLQLCAELYSSGHILDCPSPPVRLHQVH